MKDERQVLKAEWMVIPHISIPFQQIGPLRARIRTIHGLIQYSSWVVHL